MRSHEVLGARICACSVRRVPVESPVPVRVRANAVQYALVVWSSGLSPHSVVGLKEVMLSFLNQADQKVLFRYDSISPFFDNHLQYVHTNQVLQSGQGVLRHSQLAHCN